MRAAPTPTIDRLARVLGDREPIVLEAGRRAAVAAVLRCGARGETEVLLIERTTRPEDPWSGQMAFPGGRVEPSDSSPLFAAIRETMEEVGLDLGSGARLLGALDDLRAMARGRHLDLAIRPFVFELLDREPRIVLQRSEVAGYLWAPLEELASGRLDGDYPWTVPGLGSAILPCYRVEGRVVWGLTWRMLCDLIETASLREGR